MRKLQGKRLFKCVVILLFMSLDWGLLAQNNNDFFIHNQDFNEVDSGSIIVTFQNTNFIKNNEYFGHYTEGFTNLGFNILPSVSYYASDKFRFDAGGFFLKYSGRDEFTQIEPIFSIQYHITKDIDLILGTIKGNLFHQLPEPIYDFETFLNHPAENGLQFVLDNKNLFVDIWVDWDQFILHDDPFQEKFTAGISSSLFLLQDESFLSFEFPVQAVFRHNGGQITSAPDPLLTIMNTSLGIRANLNTGFRFIERLKIGSSYVGYEDLSPQKKQAYIDGYGIYSTIETTSQFVDVMVGHWWADQFIAPNGSYLFQSASQNKAYIENARRELLTGKLSLHTELKSGFTLAFRGEVYYDLHESVTDYAIGLYIIFNRDLFKKIQ